MSFPRYGKLFSTVWKNRPVFLRSVEKITYYVKTDEPSAFAEASADKRFSPGGAA